VRVGGAGRTRCDASSVTLVSCAVSPELNEYPFTALAPCPSSAGAGAAFGSIVLGDTVGTLVRVDLDSGRTLGGFKGAGGCIRGCVGWRCSRASPA
jgi:hypothetical protein